MVAHERKIARVVTTKNVGEHIVQSVRLRVTKSDNTARNAQSKAQYNHTVPSPTYHSLDEAPLPLQGPGSQHPQPHEGELPDL